MKFSNEFVLPHQLTLIQNEVLIGSLLGDGSISLSEKSKYPRFKIDRKILDKPYLEWQYNIFENLFSSSIRSFERYDKRYNKSHQYCSFKTRAVPAFLKYYQDWYPNGKKILPTNIQLTKLIIAVWFADDGCLSRSGKKALTLKFSTENFGKIGTEILSNKLDARYNIKFPIYQKKKDKDQWIIKTSTDAAVLVMKDIDIDLYNMNMLRKYNIWKNYVNYLGTRP